MEPAPLNNIMTNQHSNNSDSQFASNFITTPKESSRAGSNKGTNHILVHENMQLGSLLPTNNKDTNKENVISVRATSNFPKSSFTSKQSKSVKKTKQQLYDPKRVMMINDKKKLNASFDSRGSQMGDSPSFSELNQFEYHQFHINY